MQCLYDRNSISFVLIDYFPASHTPGFPWGVPYLNSHENGGREGKNEVNRFCSPDFPLYKSTCRCINLGEVWGRRVPLLISQPGINLSPLRTKDGGVGGILPGPLINGVGAEAGQFWVMQILAAQVPAPPARPTCLLFCVELISLVVRV